MSVRPALGRGLEALIPKAPPKPISAAPASGEGGTGPVTLPVTQIVPNPFQPRRTFKEAALRELAESIRSKGLLQPVIVAPAQDPGKFQIIAGERRWRAAQWAGLERIPVTIKKDLSDEQRFEISLIENLQREDLNPMEEADGYRRLSEEYGLSQEAIATAIGKDRSAIANSIRLLQLESAIQDAIREGKISAGHGRALLAIENVEARRQTFERIMKEGLNVRAVENTARESKGKKSAKAKEKNPEVRSFEQDLQHTLGRRVELDAKGATGAKGWVKLEYYSLEDLETLRAQLQRVVQPQ